MGYVDDDLIAALQDAEEMNPDSHDATYELMREIVQAYAKMSDLSECDYRDLDLVYMTTVGTWDRKISTKKKMIDASHLNNLDKARLKKLLQDAWDKTIQGKYRNSSTDMGLFSAGRQTFREVSDTVSPIRFIQMCVDIIDVEDEDAIFNSCMETLDKGISGLGAPAASAILHCLKPYVFPIFMGEHWKIFKKLGILLEKPKELTYYIQNCVKIKEYRDKKCRFKNYRIFDIASDVGTLGELNHFIKEYCCDEYNIEQFSSKMEDDITMSHGTNQILYGPPGTGKTYHTAIYAVAICDGESLEVVKKKDYNDVMQRYKELRDSRRIAFTTFHQSYGYEEFIEGIKPLVDENSDQSNNSDDKGGDVKYVIAPGVFKSFCNDARKSMVKNDTYTDLILPDATVWKVTIRKGVLQDCFDNNRVRINFGIEGGGAASFIDTIRKGDIIITTDGSRTDINGIAVASTDEAEVLDTESDATSRQVIWLAPNIHEFIKPLNNDKILHRKTVSRVPSMTVADIVTLAKTINPQDPILAQTTVEENRKPYVFVIDEINRGNISKIFGELITLIEISKREGMPEAISAKLPYSGDDFSVPQNVYILGTMNTADRSIALMDTALRRRFQFIEMMPDSGVLRGIGADTVTDGEYTLDVAAMLDKMNERITFLYDREHTIGHAYFTELKDDPSIERLQGIFTDCIFPLLQEYFYDDYQKIQLVLGDNSKSDDTLKFIRDTKVVPKNIFKGSVDETIDLPERKYEINWDAFADIRSYIEII